MWPTPGWLDSSVGRELVEHCSLVTGIWKFSVGCSEITIGDICLYACGIWTASDSHKNVSKKVCDLSQGYLKTVSCTASQLKHF